MSCSRAASRSTSMLAAAYRSKLHHARAAPLLVGSSTCFAATPFRSSAHVSSRAFSVWPSSRNEFSTSSAAREDKGKGDATSKDENRLPHQMDTFEPGWAMTHARYTNEELDNVKIVHRELSGFGDRVAAAMVGVMRWGFDVATRYPKHRTKFPRVAGSETNVVKLNEEGKRLQRKRAASIDQSTSKREDKSSATSPRTSSALSLIKSKELPEEMPLGEMRRQGLSYSPEQWLVRIVFLESVAGVPGMMAAMARHLHSLRLLRRDKGWIHTLLEDAANERQHLLVSLKLYEPGFFMRGMLIAAQGVFCNFFFLLYLVAPRVAHRFVGVLEEEAVVTYSRILDEIHAGRLPEWEALDAPAIAIDYWGLSKDAKMVDVVRALRADEASHRYINHTLAEIKSSDYNPFAYREASPATRGLTWGMTREEALAHFAKEDAEARRRFDAQEKQPGDQSNKPHKTEEDAKKSTSRKLL